MVVNSLAWAFTLAGSEKLIPSGAPKIALQSKIIPAFITLPAIIPAIIAKKPFKIFIVLFLKFINQFPISGAKYHALHVSLEIIFSIEFPIIFPGSLMSW